MALNTKVPFAVPLTKLKLLGVSPKLSLPETLELVVPLSSATVSESFTASIAGDVAVTVMLTVAVSS